MRVGVPAEIKSQEYRVGLVPGAVRELTDRGHQVLVEKGAGEGAMFPDEAYRNAGATIADNAAQIFATAEMIVKVKEPQRPEWEMLREGQVLFTYLHLAPDPDQAGGLVRSGCTAIAYETITDSSGGLPLLAPMSEVAGRMSIQAGARALEALAGGSGILLGGVPGVPPARVVIIGGGVAGINAAMIAAGIRADVTVLETSPARMRYLDGLFGGRVKTVFSTAAALEELTGDADLVIGAVLVPGRRAPKLLTRGMLRMMKRGSAVVDICIDQGGCLETSRATTHADPVYVEEGVVHYCVANMPGAVPGTSTRALCNSTLPHVLALADKGWRQALRDDPGLCNGLNVHAGVLAHEGLTGLDHPYVPAAEIIAGA